MWLIICALVLTLVANAYGAVDIHIDKCQIVKKSFSNVASCGAGEAVIGGGGVCTNSTISASGPLTGMNGWRVSCVDNALPSMVSVRCCQSNDAIVSSQTPSLLDTSSMSTLRGCEALNRLDHIFGEHLAQSSISCPSHKSAISGGGECPSGWKMSASHFSHQQNQWMIECVHSFDSQHLVSMVRSSVICCESIFTQSCRVEFKERSVRFSTDPADVHLIDSASQSMIALAAPSNLAYCAESNEVMLSFGQQCADYASFSQQSIFRPFGLESSIYTTCLNMNGLPEFPMRVDYRCCKMLESTSPPHSSFCAALPSRPPSVMSHITSSNPEAPHAHGSSYSLHCNSSSAGAFHVSGASHTVCQADGTWSNDVWLGECLALDTSGCVAVEAFAEPGAVSTSLSCPARSNGDPAWVLVAAGGICQSSMDGSSSQLHLLHDYPFSLSSWSSSCVNNQSSDVQAAALITGVCCPATQHTVFRTCSYSHVEAAADLCAAGDKPVLAGRSLTGTAAVCCSALSHIFLPIHRDFLAAPHQNDLTIVEESCTEGYIPFGWSPVVGAGAWYSLQTSSRLYRQWKRSTLSFTSMSDMVWSDSIGCFAAQPMCEWSKSVASLMDHRRTPAQWPFNSTVSFYCPPGYATSNGRNEEEMSCGHSTRVEIPQCFVTHCTSLSPSQFPHAALGPLFTVLGTYVKVSCDDGYSINGTAHTEILLKCTGSIDAAGFDWQPQPESIECVARLTDPARRLLSVAVSSVEPINAGLSGSFIIPYTLRLMWQAPSIQDYQFGPGLIPMWDLSLWHGSWQLEWPLAEFDESGKSVIAAMSGISYSQTFEVPYSNNSYVMQLDSMNYTEGMRGTVQFSAVVAHLEEINWPSVNDLAVVLVTWLGNDPTHYCLYASDSTESAQVKISETCDPSDPRFQWTFVSQYVPYAVRNMATSMCMQMLFDGNDHGPLGFFNHCDDGAGAIHVDTNSDQLKSTVKDFGQEGFVTCDLASCSWTKDPYSSLVFIAHTFSSNQVPAGSLTVSSPLGCFSSDGLPGNLSLYQNVGVDSMLRMKLSPQSFANNEFTVVEMIGNVERPIAIPNIETYLFETYASCPYASGITANVVLEQLVWNTTSVNRTFCIIPVPRPVCVTCVSEYTPPPSARVCVTGIAAFWFTLMGMVGTSSRQSGVTAPVSGVTMNIQVVPRANSSGAPQWSSDPLYSLSTVTDGNGMWTAVPAGVFSDAIEQFYDVQTQPFRVDYYMDPHPTMLTNVSGVLRLAQIGVNESISVNVDVIQQTVNVSSMIMEASADWQCPEPNGNVTSRIIVCDMTTATFIEITVRVNVSTLVTSGLMYSESEQPLVTESSIVEEFFSYTWQLPWNISFHSKLSNPSSNPVVNRAIFGVNISNPYNSSQMISAVPYMLTSSGIWISPVSLIDPSLIVRSWMAIGVLVLPPSTDQSQTICWPMCFYGPETISVQQSLNVSNSSPVYGPALKMANLAGDVSVSEVIEVSENDAWFSLTLRSGSQISFRSNNVSSVTAVPLAYDGFGPNVTDPTFALVIKISDVSLIEVISWLNTTSTTSLSLFSGLRASPSLVSVVLTLFNTSAVVSPLSLQALRSTSVVTSIPSRFMTSAAHSASFQLVLAANPTKCLGSNDCSSIRLKGCSESYTQWKMVSQRLVLSACSASHFLIENASSGPAVSTSATAGRELYRQLNSSMFVSPVSRNCLAADSRISATYVGIRPCNIPSFSRGVSVDPHQHWISSISGNVIAPIPANRSLVHKFDALSSMDQSPIDARTMAFAQTPIEMLGEI